MDANVNLETYFQNWLFEYRGGKQCDQNLYRQMRDSFKAGYKESRMWHDLHRPGYFGRKRDEKIKQYNNEYGEGNWRLSWIVNNLPYNFGEACILFYEESYYQYLKDKKEDLDFICSFGECIDNANTNIQSGLDYNKQEAYSTHIQDIAVRNVLKKVARKFEGPSDRILVIRSKDSEGFRWGPGNIPFYEPKLITKPELCPKWANKGSVESFWQSNKWIQIKKENNGTTSTTTS